MSIKAKTGRWNFLIFSLIVLLAGCASSQSKVKKEESSKAYYKLGIAYLNDAVPNPQKAYIEFLKSVEIDPENKDAHYAVGHIYAQRQDYPHAIESFEKVISIDPNYSEAHNYIGKVYEISGKDAEAIMAYQNALKNLQYATPQLPHWNLGLIYIKQKKYDQALESLHEVRKLEPTNVVVIDKIGATYKEQGDSEKASSFFKEAEAMRKSVEAPK